MADQKSKEDKSEKKIVLPSDADDDLASDGVKDGSASQTKKEHRKSRGFSILGGRHPIKEKPEIVPFQPRFSFPIDTLLDHLLRRATDHLSDNNPKASAAKPDSVSTNAWIHINLVLYFNQANYYFGAVKDLCQCPNMTIRGKYEYLWADGKTIRKPISIPAQDYVDYLMSWCRANLEDRRIFPDYDDAHHTKEFTGMARTILKRLFRVFGHIYTLHQEDLAQLELAKDHEITLKCFIEFVREYKLVDKKTLRPLHKEIEAWKAQGKA